MMRDLIRVLILELSNYFFLSLFRLPDLSFDKMSVRKGAALNSGATNLDYDYKDALEKCKYDLSIKRVLPFER